jgi:hypothetical protein
MAKKLAKLTLVGSEEDEVQDETQEEQQETPRVIVAGDTGHECIEEDPKPESDDIMDEDDEPEVENPMDDGPYEIHEFFQQGRKVHMLVPVGGDKERRTVFYAIAQLAAGQNGPMMNLNVHLGNCKTVKQAFDSYDEAVQVTIEKIKQQARNQPRIMVPNAQVPPDLQPGYQQDGGKMQI